MTDELLLCSCAFRASWEKKLSLLRDTVAFESQMFDQIAEEVNALSEASELQSALGPDLNELLRMCFRAFVYPFRILPRCMHHLIIVFQV